jgi:hypothetical protein
VLPVPAVTKLLMWATYTLYWGNWLALVLLIANHGGGWDILAAMVSLPIVWGGAHLAREMHLDGRLPRIGDWKQADVGTSTGFYDPNDQ